MEALHGWILKFREYRKIIRTSVETFSDWLANGIPPWAAYHAFMYDRLIALDKQPGVHLVGVGETKRRLFDNCMLRFMVPEATSMFQDDQICAGLRAGIDVAVHRVQVIWYTESIA